MEKERRRRRKKKFGESHSLARTGPYGDKVRNHIEIKEKETDKQTRDLLKVRDTKSTERHGKMDDIDKRTVDKRR